MLEICFGEVHCLVHNAYDFDDRLALAPPVYLVDRRLPGGEV
jgi:hypothetical protein